SAWLLHPVPLRPSRALMQEKGRAVPGFQRRTEGIEAGKTKLPIDHRLVREAAARAAILLGNCGTKKPGCSGLAPDLAVIHAVLAPPIEVRHILGGNEAP